MTKDRFVMVSEWMTNGNITQFVREHRDADRFELVSPHLSSCKPYPHLVIMCSPQVERRRERLGLYSWTGDDPWRSQRGSSSEASASPMSIMPFTICQANILVDRARHARLADFGLLTIISSVSSDSTASSSHTPGGTIRWMGPELFDPEIQDHRRTKYSDCYSLGMVIYEVLSERLPFYKHTDFLIVGMVSRGDRPQRLEGTGGAWFTDDVWGMLERCWIPQPKDRPNIQDVLQCLEIVPRSRSQLSSLSMAIQPTASSQTWGSSDIVTGESTSESETSSHSQPSEKQGVEESMEIIGERYKGGHRVFPIAFSRLISGRRWLKRIRYPQAEVEVGFLYKYMQPGVSLFPVGRIASDPTPPGEAITPVTITTKIEAQGPIHHDPTQLEAGIREFLNNRFLIENFRRFLLANEDDLRRAIQALTQEEQESFADKLDQVCRSNVCQSFSPTFVHKGMPGFPRNTERQALDDGWEALGGSLPTAGLGRNLHRTCFWNLPFHFWSAHGRLAGKARG